MRFTAFKTLARLRLKPPSLWLRLASGSIALPRLRRGERLEGGSENLTQMDGFTAFKTLARLRLGPPSLWLRLASGSIALPRLRRGESLEGRSENLTQVDGFTAFKTLATAVLLTAAIGLGPRAAVAQSVTQAGTAPTNGATAPSTLLLPTARALTPATVDLSPAGAAMPPSPFKSIGGDFRRFVSGDTARMLTLAAATTLVARSFDAMGVEESQEHLPRGLFKPGNIGGSFFVQSGAAFGTWAIGHATDNATITALGGDLIRAQILSQGVVQAAKLVARRQRPDDSDQFSFPSGHTSSAFATAGVIQQHFGWKAGAPAFAFAAYVGAARMSANKHHLSDVVMGAAIGLAAAHTVTFNAGGHRFDVGVAPTMGGAAVTFTRR